MAAKFELYKDKAGEYRWRLRHQNGNIIADSGEGYKTKANAINGINSVKENVKEAGMKELEAPAKPAPAPEAPKAAAPKPPKAVRYSPGVDVEDNGSILIPAIVLAVVAFFVLSAGVILAAVGAQ
jgi:uncharacterized protein YegP (UPF0339 family)